MNQEATTTSVCPYCSAPVGEHFEIHEVLVHPEKRARFYTPDYIEWKANQEKALTKKKKKKS